MTTIAWDGTTLAADGAGWSGGVKHRIRKVHKIKARDGRVFLVAMSGDQAFANMVLAWMRGGQHPGAYPNTDGVTIAVVIDEKRSVWRLDSQKLAYSQVLEKIHSSGAGQEVAIGALEAGATAVQAIRIAMKRTDMAGLAVDSVRF
jgi:hypothetical protein